MDYRDAGVDVEAGRAFVDQIRRSVEQTYRPEVISKLGGFSGFFRLPSGYQEPILVSGTDGVGTKLKIAHTVNRHDTVGIDLVAMCVNDVLTCGAEPLFFLDYIATGKLNPEQLAAVVSGISQGCQQAGCALLGGETAEMPGFYQPGEYDLAGFCVGIVDRPQLLDGSQVKIGDIAIALASNGIHSNGFSLVRKIIESHALNWTDCPVELGGKSLGEICLSPTQIYVKPILSVRRQGLEIHGMAHITGGGLPENLPRCLGENQAISLNLDGWSIPQIFHWLAEQGNVNLSAMFNTFNMGIGYVVLVPPDQVQSALKQFDDFGIPAFEVGQVVSGNGELLGLPEN